jgi:hypothetical protein
MCEINFDIQKQSLNGFLVLFCKDGVLAFPVLDNIKDANEVCFKGGNIFQNTFSTIDLVA